MIDPKKTIGVWTKKYTIIQAISIIMFVIIIIEIGTCIQDLQIAITSCYHVLCHSNISDTKYKLLYSFRILVFMHLCNCYLFYGSQLLLPSIKNYDQGLSSNEVWVVQYTSGGSVFKNKIDYLERLLCSMQYIITIILPYAIYIGN